jgi:hypothetical protein
VCGPAQPSKPSQPQPIFGTVSSPLITETVIQPDHPNELCLETWNGHKAQISTSARFGDREFVPGRIGSGMGRAIRFPPPSKPFGSPAKLIASMRDFLLHYAQLTPETAALLVVFALASWFSDCCSYLGPKAKPAGHCNCSRHCAAGQHCCPTLI